MNSFQTPLSTDTVVSMSPQFHQSLWTQQASTTFIVTGITLRDLSLSLTIQSASSLLSTEPLKLGKKQTWIDIALSYYLKWQFYHQSSLLIWASTGLYWSWRFLIAMSLLFNHQQSLWLWISTGLYWSWRFLIAVSLLFNHQQSLWLWILPLTEPLALGPLPSLVR